MGNPGPIYAQILGSKANILQNVSLKGLPHN